MADDTKPVQAGDDFTDDDNLKQDDLNSVDKAINFGVGPDALPEDEDDSTLVSDEPTDNPLDTSTGMDEDELDSDVEGKQKIGDTVEDQEGEVV